MYDSLKNIKLLSKSKDIESFDKVGLNKIQNFKLQKMELPKWAIDWSKNRLNMNVENVKLCIADEKNVGIPFAASSGNNIFITNEYKDNKLVLKHEITHIYQQAIGIATEKNSNDGTLEEEAIKVSHDKGDLSSLKQNLDGEYITPRENTNKIQYLNGLDIAKPIIEGLILGHTAANAINWLSRRIKCKQIADEMDIPIECISRVYDIFDWVEYRFDYSDFKRLCRAICDKDIATDKLIEDNKKLKNNCKREDIYNYITTLENDAEPILTIKGEGGIITSGDTKNLDKVKKVIIEDGVREIGERSFENCKCIEEVVIPQTVTRIHELAFSGCENLESIVLPKGLEEIRLRAFGDCKRLKEVEIPKGITEVADGLFGDCEGLQSVVLPSELKKIEKSAFLSCKSLDRINLPDNITEIGMSTFDNCTGLKEVILPKKLQRLSGGIFYNCVSLNEITLPENMKVIDEQAFGDCAGLTKVVFPSKLEVINKLAFLRCINLSEIELPESLNKIKTHIFLNCTNLKNISIPRNVKKIPNFAFCGCSKLESIDLPENLHSIGCSAFLGCTGLKTIKLPKSLQTIGQEAFSGCTGLKNIHIPSGVKKIECGSFYYLKNLENIKLGNKLEKIENCTFYGCESLKSITIPNKVKSIGKYAFANCKNLNEVNNFPKHTFCDKSAFMGCERLKLSNSFECGVKHKIIDDGKFFYSDKDGKKKSIKVEQAKQIPLFSKDGPNMDDVQQGYMGDCWLLATLASIVNVKPEIIKNMIVENPESNTVDVTLQRELEPGMFIKEVYTVKKSLFHVKKGLFGKTRSLMSKSKETIWVQMIEKAFSAYFANDEDAIDYRNIAGSYENYGRDYTEKDAFKIILGNEANFAYKLDKSSANVEILFKMIKEALDNKTPLYYSTDENGLKDIEGDKVFAKHAYSLIGSEEKNGKYFIKLRNPWGENYDEFSREKGDVITVDLAEATKVNFEICNLKKKEDMVY